MESAVVLAFRLIGEVLQVEYPALCQTTHTFHDALNGLATVVQRILHVDERHVAFGIEGRKLLDGAEFHEWKMLWACLADHLVVVSGEWVDTVEVYLFPVGQVACAETGACSHIEHFGPAPTCLLPFVKKTHDIEVFQHDLTPITTPGIEPLTGTLHAELTSPESLFVGDA